MQSASPARFASRLSSVRPGPVRPAILVVGKVNEELEAILTALENAEFEVFTVGEGETALQILRGSLRQIDVLIAMSEAGSLSAAELCEKAKGLKRSIRSLIVVDPTAPLCGSASNAVFIRPVHSLELVRSVRKLLA